MNLLLPCRIVRVTCTTIQTTPFPLATPPSPTQLHQRTRSLLLARFLPKPWLSKDVITGTALLIQGATATSQASVSHCVNAILASPTHLISMSLSSQLRHSLQSMTPKHKLPMGLCTRRTHLFLTKPTTRTRALPPLGQARKGLSRTTGGYLLFSVMAQLRWARAHIRYDSFSCLAELLIDRFRSGEMSQTLSTLAVLRVMAKLTTPKPSTQP
jgi:hypothetical protein